MNEFVMKRRLSYFVGFVDVFFTIVRRFNLYSQQSLKWVLSLHGYGVSNICLSHWLESISSVPITIFNLVEETITLNTTLR